MHFVIIYLNFTDRHDTQMAKFLCSKCRVELCDGAYLNFDAVELKLQNNHKFDKGIRSETKGTRGNRREERSW